MSQENVEQIIRQLYQRWNAEGIGAAAKDFFDPEIEYHDDAAWPGGGKHNGRAAVIARFGGGHRGSGNQGAPSWSAWSMPASRLPGDTGQRNIARADVPHDHRWGYTGRIVHGKLVYFRAFYNPDDALEAVGLEG